MAFSDYSHELLPLVRKHGGPGPDFKPIYEDWKRSVAERELKKALAVRAQVLNWPAHDAWEAHRRRAGLSASIAGRFAPADQFATWFEPAFDQWRKALAGNDNCPWRTGVSHDDCPLGGQVLGHVASFDGQRLGLVVVRGLLQGRDCGRTLTAKEWRAELDRQGAKRAQREADEPDFEATYQRLLEMMQNFLERNWDEAMLPAPMPPPPPTEEERRAKRLERLKCEAEKLGVRVVDE